ncbi:MAG: N-acetylglucosamine-6-phosphate deacetylase [Paenibacillus sp.]|nr:N-acetylglucosamine-6-phosphate deacetylase [Paenibacillus sp.]
MHHEAEDVHGGQWIGRSTETGDIVKITVQDEHIVSVEQIENEEGRAGDSRLASEVDNVPWISPGWIDLQVNGFAGYDFNEQHTSVHDVLGVLNALFACGVTSCLPTIVTGSRERIEQAFRALARVSDSTEWASRSMIGYHLEGPYTSKEDGPRGAHLLAYIRDPDWDEFNGWQEASGGRIRMVTLAPEREGAIPFIADLTQMGIVAAIGHTAAAAEQIEQAVAAGATMSTHLGNGSHPILPRHPNYIWDQLANDKLWAGLIADGHHLPSSVLKVMLRMKRDKAILVSDAVKFAGMPPGRYSTVINAEVELHPNGRLHTVANPAILAGSASPLVDGIANVVNWGGVTLAEAIRMVTLHPSQLMGLNRLGRLEPGAAGNLTLFDWKPGYGQEAHGRIIVRETVLEGRTMYRRDA